jgi:anthranilate phosphoribosyltransferase
MQTLFEAVSSGLEITGPLASQAVEWLADPAVDSAGKESFLEKLRAKGESARELADFARALISLALQPRIDPGDVAGPILDVCGTGGDKLELFNISTASMFVLAGGGASVVKHGNRAITSQCGGADVLEALGVRIELNPHDLRECVCRHGLGFVFAPAYHPAFAVIAPVRRNLAKRGIPTIFNLLGPLLNPVKPDHQLVGVFDAGLLDKYAEALRHLERRRAWVLNGSGADELTLAGPSVVADVCAAQIKRFELDPLEIGLKRVPLEALRGGDRARNAAILVSILSGELRGAPADTVMLNSAAGFVVAGLCNSLSEGLSRARESIESGAAHQKLRALQGV